jgi:hypothetical protein
VLEAVGIETPLSNIPGIEKYVEFEFNAGEQYAEKAVEYYAQILADPDSPWYQKALAYLGGTFASLWTCENSSTTVTTLLSALNVRKLLSSIKIQDVKDGFEYAKDTVNDFLRGNNRNRTTPSSIMDCSSSFLAGTEVLTPDGLVNIEDIEVGDWVISDDPTTEGGVVAKQVTRTFERTDNNGIVEIILDDELISTTGNHEFWLDEKGWVEAKDIKEGDLLWTEDGDLVAVEGISKREGTFEVFNFEVDDFHTYFVSTDGVLVHNVNCDITNPILEQPRVGYGHWNKKLEDGTIVKVRYEPGSGNTIDQINSEPVIGLDGKPLMVNDPRRTKQGKIVDKVAMAEFPAGSFREHGFTDIVDNYAGYATQFPGNNGSTIYQLEGSLNGNSGVFEWIIDPNLGGVSHRRFKKGQTITGKAN